MELSDCPNFVTDWVMGNRTGLCEDCGHPKNKHPRQALQKTINLECKPSEATSAPVVQQTRGPLGPPDYLSGTGIVEQNYQMRCGADCSSKLVERTNKVVERPKVTRNIIRSHEPQQQTQPKGLMPTGKQPLLVASDDAPADSAVTIPSEVQVLAAQELVASMHADVVNNHIVPNVPPVDPSKTSQAANSDTIVTTIGDSKVHSQSSKRSQPIRRKNFWTIEEDNLLLKFVQKYGHYGFWPNIALKLVNRTGKQCRERFLNHLSPDIKRSPWTAEEDNTILRLHLMLGSRWSKYVEHLPGRSDNAIKNRWNVINGTMSPKHDLFNIIAHEQGVSLESSAPKLVFDYSMYGAPKSFYPKLIANSIARDPEPQADSREWSHSLLEAISIITSGESKKRRADDSSDESAQGPAKRDKPTDNQ